MEENVLEIIAKSNKMPILFIGSGISKRYLEKFPDWRELLELSFKAAGVDEYYYQSLINKYKKEQLSEYEINKKLATEAQNAYDDAFYKRKIKSSNAKTPAWVKRGVNPYKMFLSRKFKSMHFLQSERLSKELSEFKQLRNKISAVITTNYDCFIEKEIFNSDYKVFIHQNELFSSDSYNIAEIYKIHGCVTDADSIVITEKDYELFNQSRKLFIAKMLTLFAESPIIFLGYSFTDENISEIVEDFLSCLSPKDLVDISNHFVFISYQKDQQELKQIHRTIVGKHGDIPITEIQTDNYEAVYRILNKITPGISPKRIRETRRLVKNIVDQSVASGDASALIIGLEDLEHIDYSSKPLAIAIGYRESIIGKSGYDIIPDDIIIDDILFNNQEFNAKEMCLNRFKSISTTRLLPVFKYVSSYPEYVKNEKLVAYVDARNSINKIVANNINKKIKNLPVGNSCDEIKLLINSEPNFDKKSGILLHNLNNINFEDFRKLCEELAKEASRDNNSTNFKRCVMYIDLIENGECFR